MCDGSAVQPGDVLQVGVVCVARRTFAVDALSISLRRTLALVDHDYDVLERRIATEDQWRGWEGRNPMRGEELRGDARLRLGNEEARRKAAQAVLDRGGNAVARGVTAQWHVELALTLADGATDQRELHPAVRGYETFGLVDG